MPRFAFQARGAGGELVKGVEHAASELALDRQLAASDLFLIGAEQLQSRRRRGNANRGLVDFCYHLATVSEAGIPILEGLRDLADGEHPFEDQISDVARKVEQGESLSQALSDHPRCFPDLVCSLIKAGEESGSLDRVLRDLVTYLEWREQLRRQVSSAATYPILVLVGICGLGVLLSAWVLPRFLEIFVELGANLPPTTRAILWLHDFFVSNWLIVLAAVVATLVASVLALRREPVRAVVDALVLRMPVLGTLVLMIELSRFAHNLGLLQSTGTPMLKSLEMVEQVVQNRVFRGAIARGRERIEQGATLTDSLGRNDLMPPLVLRMLSVGETSGRLEESLERVAVYYDREVPMIVDRSIAIFNLAVMLLLGATLVTIALSIFGPLYQMMGELSA